MSIYDITYNIQGERLSPVNKRKPKLLAWMYSILKPMQWVRDTLLGVYKTGSTDPAWFPLTLYLVDDRVIFTDGCVYSCIQNSFAQYPDANPNKWYKLQDTFIGVDERLKYNSQIIVYEYALNRWFRNIGATDQIYIVNNTTNSDAMLMANTSELSSTMANNSVFSNYYMGNSYTPGVQYDYTIMVPAALFATLGATTQDQENAVRNIAEKYNMAGMQYNVLTF